MSRHRTTRDPHGITGLMMVALCALCALVLTVGCAAQEQTTETASSTGEVQTEPAQEEAGTESTEGADDEQETANELTQEQSAEATSPADLDQMEPAQEEAGAELTAGVGEEQEKASALAQERLTEAETVEPAITQTLQSFEDDTAQLVALDYRFKRKESLARKIVSDAHEEEISLEEAATNINDVVRYTLCVEPSDYVTKVTAVLKDLEAQGYMVAKFKNLWSGDLYKGLNTQLVTPEGYAFELQFHTPKSFEVKEQNHVYYEKTRAEDATEEEVAEAMRAERESIAGVEIPPGALDLTWQ